MPIKIPNALPGRVILERERIPFILEDRALRQDIRPLQIAILNLMPDKVRTETQILRALGATPLQVEITLLRPRTHESKNTDEQHLDTFYKTHDEVAHQNFDGLIVTGAPIEHLDYTDVKYWEEFMHILEWARTHVFSSFFICWAAQAALFHYNGLKKSPLPAKQCGIYRHRISKLHDPLLSGFDDYFDVPVSRNAWIPCVDIVKQQGLEILAESDVTGSCLLRDAQNNRIYIFNHLEYDAETLQREYERDKKTGGNPTVPFNYFPGDDPMKPPRITWRAHRNLLFSNWINIVYQGTPYDLSALNQQALAA